MGWTLFACFGSTNNNERKRRRYSKFVSKNKRIQGYHQLDEEFREKKPKVEKKTRIKKKVRFNLDVIVYEPISNYETNNLQEDKSFPASYRYNNCYGEDDNYVDDEDKDVGDEDSECELSDLEDDDDDENVVNGGELLCRPLIRSGSADKGLRLSCDKTTTCEGARRHYVVSVLKPIENTSQWKAIKARKI